MAARPPPVGLSRERTDPTNREPVVPYGLFLGYSSRPEATRETLYQAGRLIHDTQAVRVTSWEDLKIDGRVIIRQIFDAIDAATVCAFDVSTLNENVLFELGYAVARGKAIWLLLDATDTEVKRRWRQFELLSGVGYTGWENSEDIRNRYLASSPHTQTATLYTDIIAPNLEPSIPGSIFYITTYHSTNAAKAVSRRLDQELKRGVRLVSADPSESSLNTLQWLATKTYECECTIVHFESPRRELASLHNPRSAFVAGLARGFERKTLMLSEEDYARPLDYGDLLKVYENSRECLHYLDTWLREQNLQPRSGARAQRVKLATELRALRFGEHVAENEVDTLSDYFVRTAAFDAVMSQKLALFVGRKGAGKSANMYQAAARLTEDVRNLVVVIKPPSYEFESLLALLRRLPISMQQYSIEGIWKFLLTSEIAKRVVETVEARPISIPYTEEEKRLLEVVETMSFGLRDDFSARFERTVTALTSIAVPDGEGEAQGRDRMNEALHSQAIARLRSALGPVLKHRNRVAVLIDNLDKGWDRHTDLELLAKLLLGLLSAIGRVSTDFAKEDYWRDRVTLTVATFLRSDIFAYIRTIAREPDKILGSMVAWDDEEVLLRVLEERFLAARPESTPPEELWSRFFCPDVEGVSTKRWLLRRILPRPRDLIYLCNAAIAVAINRTHEKIEAEDLHEAERGYSQFAFESLLVENGITIEQLKDVLFELMGEPATIEESRAVELIQKAGISEDMVNTVLDRLKAVSFFGVEVGQDRFEFPEVGIESERASVLARKLCEERRSRARLLIHPAFRAYLEIEEPAAGSLTTAG